MIERGRAFLELWPELLAATLAAILFLPTIGYELVFDDRSLIGPDGPAWLGGRWLPYRPARYASLWLDHALGAGGAWAFHLTNIALHVVTVLLVARIVRRLGAGSLGVAIAAAIFAVHPLCVEVVAYVAGRRDLLASACGMAALLLWMSPAGRTAAALALVLLGVAAKESALLYLPLLGLASVFGYGPPLRRASGSLVCALVAGLMLPVAYGARGPLAPAGPAAEVAVVAGALAAHYAGNFVLPTRLSVEYPHLLCAGSCDELWGTPAALGLTGLLLLVGGCALALARRVGAGAERSASARSGVGFAYAWLLTLLLPVVTVIGRHEPGADRHAYPMIAAVAAIVALSLSPSAEGQRVPHYAALLLVATWLAALALLTSQQLPVWRDEHALWAATVEAAPSSLRARHNLAGVLIQEGEYRQASRHLRRALRLDPDYVPSLLGLAAVACARGNPGSTTVLLARARARGADPALIAQIAAECATRKGRP